MSSSLLKASDEAVDPLAVCAQERIHIPGTIQPHGMLLAIDPETGRITHASVNIERLWKTPASELIGRPIGEMGQLGSIVAPFIVKALTEDLSIGRHTLEVGETFEIALAASGHTVLIELEEAAGRNDSSRPFDELYPFLLSFVSRMDGAKSGSEAAARYAAEQVRELTGFDRVLVYRFEEDWSGSVIAEVADPSLPPYLGLRFPATDIPEQARRLYEINHIRIIAEAPYRAVEIVGPSHPPLDLSRAALRSVSPVHVEYLKNMGVAASMSISLLVDNKLWGLISCHHRTKRLVPIGTRRLCDYLGRLLSSRIGGIERRKSYEARLTLTHLQTRLVANMAEGPSFVDGLLSGSNELLAFQSAGGAAIVFGGKCHRVGYTPPEKTILQLVDRLAHQSEEEVVASDTAMEEFHRDGANGSTDTAGYLAISISKLYKSYIVWFRPEVVRTIEWGGDPRKQAPDSTGRIHPRKSFEIWKETVKGQSLPWTEPELEAAANFRNAVVGIVLRKAEELAHLSEELARANKELEAFSYSVSHDLRAPFRHIVGYSELLKERVSGDDPTTSRYLDTIIDAARYAGTLVDNLLSFSQMGRSALHPVDVDLALLVSDVVTDVGREYSATKVTWDIGALPRVRVDILMFKLALRNLFSNAVKYSSKNPEPRVIVRARQQDGAHVISIKDNGVGFDMTYQHKLFGVFQRLHRVEEFEGTGIGLANVKRIVERHGGAVWAESEVNQGATFFVSLPIDGERMPHAETDPIG